MQEIVIKIKVRLDGSCEGTVHIDGEHKATARGDTLGDVIQLLELNDL